jgi:hypothetical protein
MDKTEVLMNGHEISSRLRILESNILVLEDAQRNRALNLTRDYHYNEWHHIGLLYGIF